MTIEKLTANVGKLAGLGGINAPNSQQNGTVFEVLLTENLSTEEQIKAKAAAKIAQHNAALEKAIPDPKEEFRELMEKDSGERLREIVLMSLGITEEQLDALPPEERAKMEAKISQMIEDKIRMATEEELQKSAVTSATGAKLDAESTPAELADAQDKLALSTDEARKDDWLVALGIPQDGKLQVGFTAFGELKMTGAVNLTTGVEEIL